jgi:hypothetical protein
MSAWAQPASIDAVVATQIRSEAARRSMLPMVDAAASRPLFIALRHRGGRANEARGAGGCSKKRET